LPHRDLHRRRRVAERVVPDLLAEEKTQLGVVAQALEVAQPQDRAHVDVRDHLGHAPSAVAVGTMQVAVADAADDVLQPGQRGAGAGGGVREPARAHPSGNGWRVARVSPPQTDLVWVSSRMASTPFSRPMPLAPNPPKGTCGATTR